MSKGNKVKKSLEAFLQGDSTRVSVEYHESFLLPSARVAMNFSAIRERNGAIPFIPIYTLAQFHDAF